MRETHRQGGIVNLAHLRRELEFQLDAALGELDTVDILTDTELHKEALPFWYHMLNCGFRLPATGGTDRAAAHIPLGHQRVYVQMTGKFDYARWLEGIRRGNSFATNGPMVTLTVDGSGPGAELRFPAARRVRIRAEASSQLPFEKLEIVVNGKAIRQAAAGEKGRAAALDFETEVGASAWIAARALGSQHPEIMYYPHPEWSHPVAAHTSPVYVRVGESRIAIAESACFLLERMHKLEQWATTDAYFGDAAERERALGEIRKGTEFYRKMCGR
jgi:hypothetical protein